MIWVIINLVLLILIILIITLVIVSYSKNLFLYYPVKYDHDKYQRFRTKLLTFVKEENVENLMIETNKDIHLDTWYLKNPNRKHVFLFCHGNAGNVTDRLENLKFLYEYGSVIVYDYRGFGKSSGSITWCECHDHTSDLEILYDKLQSQFKIPSKDIILVGESLGCSFALWLATKYRFHGVILLSPFYSLEAMMEYVLKNSALYSLLMKNIDHSDFTSNEWIAQINRNTPIIIIHSEDDEIIPYKQAEDLSKLHKNAKLVKITGTHNNPSINSEVLHEINLLVRV